MLEYLLTAVFESVVLVMAVFYLQRRQRSADARAEERSSLRRRESLLNLQMSMAGNKLAYATAVAIERGSTNGELKEAKEAFNDAKAAYLEFLNEQAATHLAEE